MSSGNCLQETLSPIRVYSALDVGCGQGAFTRTLANTLGSVEQIIGIDPDKDSLDEARNLTDDRRISYRLLSGYSMPYGAGRFDLVAISDALHHVPDPSRLLSLMLGVLAPNGWLVVQELVSDGLSRAEENGRDLHHFKSQIDRLNGRAHNPTFTRDELRALLASSAAVVEIECEVIDPGANDSAELAERARYAQTFLPEYLEHARDTLAYEDLSREAVRIAERATAHGVATPPKLLIRARNA